MFGWGGLESCRVPSVQGRRKHRGSTCQRQQHILTGSEQLQKKKTGVLTESSSGAVGVSLDRQQHLHESRGEAWHCTGGLPRAWPCSRHPASRASRQPATVLRLSAMQLVNFPCPAEK